MIDIGCHLSVSKGLVAMGLEALKLGANTMQFFLGNPRGYNKSSIDQAEMVRWKNLIEQHNFSKFVVHAPYTVNLCSHDDYIREYSKQTILREIELLEFVPGNFYNIHPGCHVGNGIEKGIEFISEALTSITPACVNTTILLETMSGKGTEVGSKFTEISEIISKTSCNDKIGVCLDTCHVFAAGYDMVDKLDEVLEEFNNVIGLDRLKAVHLNDSIMPLGSKKDRHAKIGDGLIGLEAIVKIINHPVLRNLPFILETPNDDAGYLSEICLLKSKYVDN